MHSVVVMKRLSKVCSAVLYHCPTFVVWFYVSFSVMGTLFKSKYFYSDLVWKLNTQEHIYQCESDKQNTSRVGSFFSAVYLAISFCPLLCQLNQQTVSEWKKKQLTKQKQKQKRRAIQQNSDRCQTKFSHILLCRPGCRACMVFSLQIPQT